MSTQKEFIAELVKQFTYIDSITEEVKEIKDLIKQAGFDPVILSAVAKSIVKSSVDELSAKSEDILAAIEVARS